MPIVLPEVEASFSRIVVLSPLEQALRLSLLARIHPLGHDVRQSSLGDGLQEVLAVELSIHQHPVDVEQTLSAIQQLLNDLAAAVALSNWLSVQHQRNCIADQLYGRPLVGALSVVPFRPDYLVFVACSVTSEWVLFGDIDSDQPSAMKYICLAQSIDYPLHRLSIHLTNLIDGEVA